MATRVRSYSKINLGLRIGPVRPDGFHGLATLYQTLALHDFVTVEAHALVEPTSQNRDPSASSGQVVGHPHSGFGGSTSTTKITLTTNDARVPTDARNTAWKMVELALTRIGVAAEVAIHIEKRLPVQGGMGAGSANAAAALIGLERELGTSLPELARLELAAEVGSDVPLFLIGGAILGTGRGEQVSPMQDLPATWCVVAVPDVGVSTPRAFRDWDEKQAAFHVEQETGSRLTHDPQPDRLEELSHAYASVLGSAQPVKKPDPSGIVRESSLDGLAGNNLLALVRTGIENDFEQVVFPQYPLLREIKRVLMGTTAGVRLGDSSNTDPVDSSNGALYAALSGSGSALFGLYATKADAEAAQQRVQALGCKAILTETLPRQEYWRRMFAE